jgi:hypothetical protein
MVYFCTLSHVFPLLEPAFFPQICHFSPREEQLPIGLASATICFPATINFSIFEPHIHRSRAPRMQSGRKNDRQVLDALNSVLEGSQNYPDSR